MRSHRLVFTAASLSLAALSASAQPPVNDLPAGALEVAVPFSESGLDVAEATADPSEPPLNAPPASGEARRTVWYHFTNSTLETIRVRCDAASSEYTPFIEFFQDDPETPGPQLTAVGVTGEVVVEEDIPGVDPKFNPLGSSVYIVFADFTEPPEGMTLRFQLRLAAGDIAVTAEQVADYLAGSLDLSAEQTSAEGTSDADANDDFVVDAADVVFKINLRNTPVP